MADRAAIGEAGLAREEAALARAAAAGDGDAFATLYERYARRAYNLAHRLSGSEDDAADAVQEAFVKVLRRLPELGDRELAFGSYLFTATRNATYDLMRRQQRTRPSDSIPEGAVPVGAGAGGLGLDPGDPEDDPERRAMLASQQEEIGAANARLPERQREALALRELEELSYDEIAAVMEMNRNSVAQLISRARINLRDELRGTALASVAASSPECERALPLLAMRDDGQLDSDSEDGSWLDAHLAGCDTCGLAGEAMQEAGATYRAWVPVAIAPWLFRETAARAAELSGADWSEVVERRLAAPDPAARSHLPPAYTGAAGRTGPTRRRVVLAAATLALLFGAGAAVLAGGSGDSTPPPAEEASAAPPAETVEKTAAEHRRPADQKPPPKPKAPEQPAAPPPVEQPVSQPPPAASGEGGGQESSPQRRPSKAAKGGKGGVEQPQAVAAPPPKPPPAPQAEPPQPAPPPAATPPPATPPPAPEPTDPAPQPEPPRDPPREPRPPPEQREPPPSGVPIDPPR